MAILTYPKFQSPDISGVNLSGGKVNFYEVGTSTRKDTWTDSGKGTTNSNPVILDARGEADIYLDGSYKIILTDENDVEVWSEANYTQPADQLRADLASTTVDKGASLISFEGGGAVEDKSGKFVSTVAALKLLSPAVGMVVRTEGYYATGDDGHATYRVVAPQAFDGFGDHELANNNIAMLMSNGVQNVKQFGAKTGIDSSASFAAAITKAEAYISPHVYVPPEVTYYQVGGLSITKDLFTLDASGAYIRNFTANDMFTLSASRTKIKAKRITNNVGAGHVFKLTGVVGELDIDVDFLSNLSTAKNILRCVDSEGAEMHFAEIKGKLWYQDPAATASAIYAYSNTITIFNQNRFTFTRSDRGGTLPFFNFKMDAAGYFYNNVIDTSWEVTHGGAVALYSCYGTEIKNGAFYDMASSATTRDLFLLDAGAGGTPCKNTIFSNITRTDGTLGASLFDINLVAAENTTIINSGNQNAGSNVAYQLNGKEVTAINLMNVTLNGAGNANVITPNGVRKLQTELFGPYTIASGVITVSGYSFISVETESLAITDDLDTINGALDGQRLVIRTVSSARDVVVKHATGNIRLAGGADFTLAEGRYKIELIYDAGIGTGEWHEISRSANA